MASPSTFPVERQWAFYYMYASGEICGRPKKVDRELLHNFCVNNRHLQRLIMDENPSRAKDINISAAQLARSAQQQVLAAHGDHPAHEIIAQSG